MNRIASTISFVLVAGTISALAQDLDRFMRFPDVNRDRIVFSYEGDLWLASIQGGVATRITNHPANEIAPKFSPDGKWIAFTGNYDGANSVYVIPATGGEPRRITYAPGPLQAVAWTPDGQHVVFRSGFENTIQRDPKLYIVDREGSAPERLPLDRGVLCSFSPDGRSLLYCRKGSEEGYWKRYKGGQYQDIWLYNFDTREFTPVSDYVGKNSYPLWIGDRMYFVSDRTNGIANLYVQDLKTKQITQLTAYDDFDVMMPSTDGKNIVFMYNGFLHLMSVPSHEIRRVPVTIPSDKWVSRNRYINPKDYIHSVEISNDGRSVVLEARGDLFVTLREGGNPRNISNSPGTREMYPSISPDGKWVAFFSDRTGEYQLYLQSASGGEWTQLTAALNRTNYHPVWSPDGKKILFGNKSFSLFVLDVESKQLAKIDESQQGKNDEFYWEISDYSWSPDSKWVCYSFVQHNRNSQIYLYSLAEGKKYPVSSDFFDNLNPGFDVGGGYLYYLSSRNFDVQMDFYEDNHVIANPQNVMVVQLAAGEKPPFAEPGAEPQKAGPAPFRIDVDGIQSRTFALPVPPGNFFYLKAGKGKVAWCSLPKFTEAEYEEIFRPGGSTKFDLHVFDMNDKKEIVLPDKIRDFHLSHNGEQLVTMRETDIFATSLDSAYTSKVTGERLKLNGMVYTVDTRKEWLQIFNDTWRWYRDFFYDPGMHGRDWKALGDKYRTYLPFVSSRDELNWVLQQLVGELCVSHTYIGGGDGGPAAVPHSPVFTGLLGADLRPDAKSGRYRIERIYGPTEYNRTLAGPLARPDIDVHEGDYLLAINGTEIIPPMDYFKLLQVTTGQKVSVTVNSRPSMGGARTYDVLPVKEDRGLRYARWLNDNITRVSNATDGKVGYMHITAMGSGGVGEFDKFWRAFKFKEGIIIDVRRNSGGWTEYFLIDKLERQPTAFNVLNGRVPFRYPPGAGTGQYVAISNEDNGSDGEAFVEDFKERKIGPVVGVPSWGGLVGILNTQRTIDNGTVEQSNNAFFGREGKWLVENHGADPDVLVDNDPASVMAGKDPQLDKAIELILKNIREHPFTFPSQPPYPKK